MVLTKSEVADIAIPWIVQFAAAFMGALPLFRVGRWLLGALCLLGVLTVVRFLYIGIGNSCSYVGEDGVKRTSPSLASQLEFYGMLAGMFFATFVLFFMAYLTGWNILPATVAH